MKAAQSLSFLSIDACLSIERGYLVTVNMQHIYESRSSRIVSDAVFGDRGAHHCLDGRGAATLFRRAMQRDLPLVQGNILLYQWLTKAPKGRLLVIGSSAAIVRKVMERHPQFDTVVDERMIGITSVAEAEQWANTLASSHSGPWRLIAIALGVPKQELLAQALQHRIEAPIYCIGGSFEILADTLPRSPRWAQAIGLEGVWRLLLEPSGKRVERLIRSYRVFFALRWATPSVAGLTKQDS